MQGHSLGSRIVVTLIFGVMGCTTTTTTGSGTEKARIALDAESLCDRYLACRRTTMTREDCVKTFKVLRVVPECADALNAATCEESSAEDATSDDVCSTPCSVKDQRTCNGDGTMNFCVESESTRELYQFVADCNALCATKSLTWTGVCGTTYETQTNAQDTCWCK